MRTLAIEPALGIDELAEFTGQPAWLVRRQIQILLDAGLVRIAREESRRGMSKRYYENLRPLVLDAVEDKALSPRDRRLTSVGALRAIIEDAGPAMRNPSFPERSDRMVAELSGRVDDRGWRELAELHREMLERVQTVMKESGERLDRGAEPISVLSAQILLEMPGGASRAGCESTDRR
jgi:DNA-binding transcriptional ArsR family regulator